MTTKEIHMMMFILGGLTAAALAVLNCQDSAWSAVLLTLLSMLINWGLGECGGYE